MLLQLFLQTLIIGALIALGMFIYNVIRNIMKYAVIKPVKGTARLPIRMVRTIRAYRKDKQFRKELKAIKRAGDKLRLLADMKDPDVLKQPSVKKFALEREQKINQKQLKQAKKDGKDNFDKVVK